MKKNYSDWGEFCHSLKKTLLIMRIAIVLLLVGFLQTHANDAYAQKTRLSVSFTNTQLAKVLDQIENESEFFFLYNEKLIDANRKVSIDAKDERIDEVLKTLFAGTDVEYTITDRKIILAPAYLSESQQQGKKVAGKVTDQSGASLPGVTVVVKGTTTGIITDANGNYSLANIPVDATLQFSFVGMKSQEITVGNKSAINVALEEETIGLEDVVVIGYGAVKKSDLTGSVGTVSSETLVAKGTTSAMGALQGTIPGVNIISTSAHPSGGYSIQIRGQNSIQQGNPLYVVDGVVTSDIDFLNPSDIGRIDVLKDASSTAIYGSRGSNGVILIQTKTASSASIAKMTVTYDAYYGLRKIARMPEFMDGREWIDYRTNAYYSWNATTKNYNLTPSNKPNILHNSALLNQRLYKEDYTDWISLGTRDGHQQNHYINISGTTKDISYNIGIGYQNIKGNFILESLDQYNVKISVIHKPSKYFQSGATANISQTNSNNGSQFGYRDILKMQGLFLAYDINGKIIEQPAVSASIMGDGDFTSTGNPLLEINSGTQETRRYNIVASLFAQVSPIEGFNIKSTISPFFNRTRIGQYYGVVPSNRSVDYASSSNSESFDYTWDNQISYDKTFGAHHINTTFINSVYSTRYENVRVAAENLPYKSYWYNIFSGTLKAGDCSSAYSETKILSFAGRANYDFKGKYLATATIRYDGSSKLAIKWATFPSFALAWHASEEEFLKTDWLSNLKARFSFGYSGNNNGVNAYGTQLTPKTASNVYYDFNGTKVSGFAPGDPVNQKLTWEKTREIDFGIDYGFLRDRITGTIDIYDKLSEGLLMSRSLTLESGVNSMTDNIGSVSNKGIEFSLNSVNVRSKKFYWSTSLIFSYNKNAIVSLYDKKEDVIGEQHFIGEPINVIYDYKILGVWTQAEYDAGSSTYYTPAGKVAYIAKPGEAKTLDASGNNTLGVEDKVILGSPDPKWTGSFTSTMRFKNFDFSFYFNTNLGVFLYDQFTVTYGYNTSRGTSKVKMDYYLPPNVPIIDWNNFSVDGDGNATAQWGTSGAGHENSKYPIYRNINGAYYGNNGNYQDASFVKVKNITFGYTFNKNFISKIGIFNDAFNPSGIDQLFPFPIASIQHEPTYSGYCTRSKSPPSPVSYKIKAVNIKSFTISDIPFIIINPNWLKDSFSQEHTDVFVFRAFVTCCY